MSAKYVMSNYVAFSVKYVVFIVTLCLLFRGAVL